MGLVFLMLVTLLTELFFFRLNLLVCLEMQWLMHIMACFIKIDPIYIACIVQFMQPRVCLVEHFEKVRLWLRKNMLIFLLREAKILNNQTSKVNCNIFRCLHFNQDHSKTTNSRIKCLVSQQNL